MNFHYVLFYLTFIMRRLSEWVKKSDFDWIRLIIDRAILYISIENAGIDLHKFSFINYLSFKGYL